MKNTQTHIYTSTHLTFRFEKESRIFTTENYLMTYSAVVSNDHPELIYIKFHLYKNFQQFVTDQIMLNKFVMQRNFSSELPRATTLIMRI